MKLISICGSLREKSFNKAITNTLPELAPQDCNITQAPSFADFPLYNADLQNSDGFPEPVNALADAIAEADGVVIISPEYNFSMPGGLKNALDWISRLPDQPFKNKPVALQSAAAGMLGGARMQYHLRQTLVFLEARVFNKPEVFVSFAKGKLNEDGSLLADEATKKVINDQLTAFVTDIAQRSIQNGQSVAYDANL